MKVNELREAIKDMPGEMNVYFVGGEGLRSAQHTIKGNLIGFEQHLELASWFQDHAPNYTDSKIERETGFTNRLELIDAYKKLLAEKKEAAAALDAGTEKPADQ